MAARREQDKVQLHRALEALKYADLLTPATVAKLIEIVERETKCKTNTKQK